MDHKSFHYFLQLLKDVPFHVFWKDIDSSYLGSNEALARTAGIAHKQVAGRKDQDFPWARYADIYQYGDEQVVLTGEKFVTIEPLISHNHCDILVKTTKMPVKDESDNVMSIFGYLEVLCVKQAEKLNQAVYFLKDVPVSGNNFIIKQFFDNLSQREFECLYFLIRGMSAKKIAKQLALSYRTIEHYIESIKAKWGCDETKLIIEKAIKMGFSNVVPSSLLGA